MDTINNYKQLGYAVVIQAIKDYIEAEHSPKKQRAIIKQLRSPWLDWLSNGLSVQLADRLKTNARETYDRLKKSYNEEELEW